MTMARWIGAALAAALGVSCGGAAPPSPAAGPPSPAASAGTPSPASGSGSGSGSGSASASAPGSAPGSASASAPGSAPGSAPAPGPAPASEPAIPFPPASFKPVHERTAKPGDGVWTALPEGAAGGPPVLARTTVHPHKIKPHVYVHVIAIDLRRVELRLMAGTQEPLTKDVPPERRPGLVPAADQADLIAVFNGGFMTRHGRHGMMVDGDVFVPPRADACTVALYKDGAVRIADWAALAPSAAGMAALRQTPPCLITGGALHATIEDSVRPRKWSAAEDGQVEIRRSALGVDATGKVLLYGSGEWITAKDLAVSMQAAGAVDAAQLDINYSYTKFLFYGRPAPGDPLQVVSTLIQDTKHTKLGYVTNPAERDFFYLKRRAAAASRP